MPTAADLHPYQVDAVRFLYENPRSALYADLGLGKSVKALTLLARLRAEGWRGRCLIIAPLRVANNTWPAEIAKWRHTRGLKHKLLTGPAKHRLRILRDEMGPPGSVHIINRELVPWLVQHFVDIRPHSKTRLIRPWPYDVVIIDEFHSFQNHASQRFKSFKYVLPAIQRLHGLTATPASEGHMGLFAQTYLLDGGARFGRHIMRYRETYFDHNPYAKTWKIKPGADKLIEAKIADICLVMRAEDHLPRAEPLVIDRPVTLPPAVLDAYRRLERDFLLALPDDKEVVAETAGALASKLLQFASGAVYDETGAAQIVHTEKVAELHGLIEEAQGERLVVCYWFKSSLARLQAAFPKARTLDTDGKAERDWNAGRIPLLLLHPASGGEGVNLQDGGHIMVFFDLPWSLRLYLQARGRLDRQGQKKVVRVYHLTATGTDDGEVASRLRAKQSVQNLFLDRLRALRATLRPAAT